MSSVPSVLPVRGRLAFPAMLLGSACLAFGPWMVRLADVGPVASGFWRLALAVPVLLLLVRLSGQPLRGLNGRALCLLGLGGVFFAADLAAWHSGILRTTLGNAVLFGNVTSFAFAAYGFIVMRHWPGRTALGALLMAALGVGLLLGRSWELSPRHFTGDLLCLLAALFYTLYLIVMGRMRQALAPLPTLAAATLAGALVLLPLALLLEGRVLPHVWSPLLVLAMTSQVLGQGLLIYAVGHLEPLIAGLCLLIQPIIASAIGWMMFDERPAALDLVGAALVLGALILVRLPQRRRGTE